MTQDTQAGAGAQPAPAIQPVFLPLQQECADYATSLRSTTMQVKLEGRPEPQSMVRAADLFERAATRITQLDASASQLIEERDHAQDMADRLAQAISEEFRVDVGEHSNLNCPWHQALAVLNGEYTTDSDKDRCIAVQAGELAAARAEAKHWRTNHDNVVSRLRIFTQRPDIPKELADRLPWYRELIRLQAVEAQAAAKCLQQSAEAAAVAALKGLLSLVRREAPQLSGKVLGDAESAIAALQAAPPAPAAVSEALRELIEAIEFTPLGVRAIQAMTRARAALAAAPAQAVAVPVEPLPEVAVPDSREEQMVVIKRGADGVPTVWCDPEIVDIVRALNDGGMPTIASCSGHGEKLGSVALTEGRVLMIFPSLEEFTAAHRKLHSAPAQEHATQLAGQGPRTPGSFVNAAGISASDMPATVVRKLDAAFHDAVTFADTPAQTQGCTRSHPHEEMTPMCVLRTEIARLNHAAAVAEEKGDERTDALQDSAYAAGMLSGWNLCVADDHATFSKVRGERMTGAARVANAARAAAAKAPAAPVAHPHHCTARSADGACEECEGHGQAMVEWRADAAAPAQAQEDARDPSPVWLQVDAGVRYWEDAKVNGVDDERGDLIPLRTGERWTPMIRLSDGFILGWPYGTRADVHYKVCDDGEYFLLDAAHKRVAKYESDYVPDLLAVGDDGYGDYIILTVSENGCIVGWTAASIDADQWPAIAARAAQGGAL